MYSVGNLTDVEKLETSQFTQALSEGNRDESPKNPVDLDGFIDSSSVHMDEKYSEMTDLELMDELISGNMKAFTVLDLKYREMFLSYSRNVLRNYDMRESFEVAKDIVQDTFMSFMDAVLSGKINREAKIGNYMKACIFTKCKGYMRGGNKIEKKTEFLQSIAERNDSNIEEFDFNLIVADKNDNFSKVIQLVDTNLIYQKVRQLEEEKRFIFEANLLEGINQQLIAEELNINRRSVIRKLDAAKTDLRKMIEAEIF